MRSRSVSLLSVRYSDSQSKWFTFTLSHGNVQVLESEQAVDGLLGL